MVDLMEGNEFSYLNRGQKLTYSLRFDYYISKALSPSNDFLAVTRLAQLYLYRRWRGYAPPATCTLVPLQGTVCEENPHGCSFIALCPTMRIPENVTWHRDLVYNCVWSLLVAVDEHNRTVDETGAGTKIQKMLMTGLATGSGGVSVDQCAQQMALAFRDFENALDDPDKWQALEWPDAIAMARECGKTNKSENRLPAGRFTPRWTRIVFLIAVLTLCYPVLSKWRQSIV